MDLIIPPNSPDLKDNTLNAKLNPTEKKKKGLPKPSRNRSAFLIFSKEMRKKMVDDKANTLNPNEQLVKLGQLWKDLDKETREIYNQKAKEDKIRYLTELKEFCAKFPFESVGNKTKKNHVKKCCTAYALFLKEKKKSVKEANPSLRMVEIVKIVADQWKNLGEGEREIYKKEAEKEKEEKSDQFFQLALKKNSKEQSFKRSMKKRKKKIEEADKSLRSLGLNPDQSELTEPLTFHQEQRNPEFDVKIKDKKPSCSQDIEKISSDELVNKKKEETEIINMESSTQDLTQKSVNFLSDLVNFKLG